MPPHCRVITDLSFLHSVNAGIIIEEYLGTPFILQLSTKDNSTYQIEALGRGCKLYKVGIS